MIAYSERAQIAKHLLSKRIFTLMEEKKTNLCLAADVTSAEELLELANTVGPHLCILKTHIDIIDDFTPTLTQKLQKLAEEHQFVLFEDRKFADIGNTVMQQYEGGVYKISDWAPLTNAHPLPGSGIIEGLQKVGQPKGNGLLLIAQLSSGGNLIDEAYTKQTVELALRYPEFVVGFICQKRLTDDSSFLHLTPGIQKQSKGDALGQQYNTPEYAICERGTDVIIVGRGIIHAEHPALAAHEYKVLGWNAYESRKSLVYVGCGLN